MAVDATGRATGRGERNFRVILRQSPKDKLLASIREDGLHLHQRPQGSWETVGIGLRAKWHRPLCGTDRCFMLKLKNVEKL